jgi:hypothetical protein
VHVCERGGLRDVVKLTDFGLGVAPGSPSADLAAVGALAAALVEPAAAPALAACFANVASARELASRLRALR